MKKSAQLEDFFGIISEWLHLNIAMKVNAILAAFAVVSMGGVSVSLAEDTPAASTEKSAAPAAGTMKVFIVSAKGGG
ncbi:MAG: hypothetical protein ACI9FG_001305 [Crocinitomicaceae bacterium]|jgi:hypothetical protein